MDAEILAEKTIDALAISPRQVVSIWASSHSLDFIQALAFRIRRRGLFGGQIHSNLHLDLVRLSPSLWLDGIQRNRWFDHS